MQQTVTYNNEIGLQLKLLKQMSGLHQHPSHHWQWIFELQMHLTTMKNSRSLAGLFQYFFLFSADKILWKQHNSIQTKKSTTTGSQCLSGFLKKNCMTLQCSTLCLKTISFLWNADKVINETTRWCTCLQCHGLFAFRKYLIFDRVKYIIRQNFIVNI